MAGPAPRPLSAGARRDAAAAWLAALVDEQGAVAYAIDPRTGEIHQSGSFHHGRAAAVIRALDVHGGHPRHVERARAWLGRQIALTLRGKPVVDWPEEPARVAGTLALAAMAGVDVIEPLAQLVAARAEVKESPWHAAQCVAALGVQRPSAADLWRACVRDLEARPWAPWTAIAARALGDGPVIERCSKALVDSIRRGGPHEGGTTVTTVPEIALTAITVEALASLATAPARAACGRARRFLARWQITDRNLIGPLAPVLARGAFPASPVAWYLRGDITARALLALLPGGAEGRHRRGRPRRSALEPVRT
jgi:hypothetical protein